MSAVMSDKPRFRATDSGQWVHSQTGDSFQNFVAGLGLGTGNQSSGGHYGYNPISRNRQQMEYVFRGSWIAGRVVTCWAQDMTREGVRIDSSDDPEKTIKLEKTMTRLRVWDSLCETLQWARLYGGAVAYMMIQGEDPSTPLDIARVKPGSFKGLLPLDRWLLTPSLMNLVQDEGPDYGLPQFYEIVAGTMGLPAIKMHYSRVLRFDGVRLPYWQRIAENLWGQSVLERLWDRLIAYDSTTTGAAQLVYKAHLRTLAVPGLREIVAAGGQMLKGLLAQINQIRWTQTLEGLTVVDATDKFETHQYTFAGLDNILMQFGEQLAGAAETPLVRLLGQSPKGFGDGEADLRNYYDQVSSAREAQLGDPVERMYRVGYKSTFGQEAPEQFDTDFPPLWEPTDEENARVVKDHTAAVVGAFDSMVISRATALRELKQQSVATGVFTKIDDDEIKAAEDDPAPSGEALGLEIPEPAPPKPGTPGATGGAARSGSGSKAKPRAKT